MPINKKTKAVVLISGGLDSIIAAILLKKQNIQVYGIYFYSPFFGDRELIKRVSKQIKIPIKQVEVGKDYLKLLKKPKHGFGKNINPCIDCKIYMLKKAKQYMKSINAHFIATGEVLEQRPMSQHRKALNIIEKESGLKGLLLRPLSAQYLVKTKPERESLVERIHLYNIRGRGRNVQLDLANKLKLTEYKSPAGGCKLTDINYADKVRDLLKHNKKLEVKDFLILKYGRHFRFGKNKIIVGRHEKDNKILLKLRNKNDYIFEVPGHGSPITILQGPLTKDAIELAASLTAKYSDAQDNLVLVKYGKKLEKSIYINKVSEHLINKLKV